MIIRGNKQVKNQDKIAKGFPRLNMRNIVITMSSRIKCKSKLKTINQRTNKNKLKLNLYIKENNPIKVNEAQFQ